VLKIPYFLVIPNYINRGFCCGRFNKFSKKGEF
jgi:hypothetical protein